MTIQQEFKPAGDESAPVDQKARDQRQYRNRLYLMATLEAAKRRDSDAIKTILDECDALPLVASLAAHLVSPPDHLHPKDFAPGHDLLDTLRVRINPATGKFRR